MKPVEAVKIFLLGMITAFLAVIVFRGPQSSIAVADTGGAANNIIAVTSPKDGNLFLIDTANKYVSQYTTDSSKFRFRTGRYYNYDLQIYDSFKWGLSVKDARKQARKDERNADRD